MDDLDFSKALQTAQKSPELPEELENNLPDIFKGVESTNSLATRVEKDTPGKIKGSVEYRLEYNCAHLFIGNKQIGYDKTTNQELTTAADDSERLKEIMDMHMKAEAIIFKKEETFLKDGTVVIWIEWGTPKEPPPKKDRSFMTEEELRSPEADSEEESASGGESL